MHSLKKELIYNFLTLPTTENLKGNKIIVYTATGTFAGTPLLDIDKENNDIKGVLSYLANDVTVNYRKENNIPDDQILNGSDGYFLLSDATLYTGRSKISIPALMIFFDQVIGISVGNMD